MKSLFRRKRLLAAITASVIGALAFAAVAIAGELTATGAELGTVQADIQDSVEVVQGDSAQFNFEADQTGNNQCGSTSSAKVNRDYALDDTAPNPVQTPSNPSAAMNWQAGAGSGNCAVSRTDAASNYEQTGTISAHTDTPLGIHFVRIVFTDITNSNTTQGKADDSTADYVKVEVVEGQGGCTGPDVYNDAGPPINLDGSSVFKIGSTVPIKLTIEDCAGTLLDDLTPVVGLQRVANLDSTPVVNEDPATVASTNGKTMRWDSVAERYIYNLSTKKSQFAPGGGDLPQGKYELSVDGNLVATFSLRK